MVMVCSGSCSELAPAEAGIASWQVSGGIVDPGFIPPWVGSTGGGLFPIPYSPIRVPCFLTRLPRFEVAGSAGQDRGPDGGIGGLLAGSQEKNAVGGEQAVNASQQRATRFL